MLSSADRLANDAMPMQLEAPLFALLSATQSLVGHGPGTSLPRGPAATLGQRVRDFFHSHPAAPLLAGALPFDRQAEDCLMAPAQIGKRWAPPPPLAGAAQWSLREEPAAAIYALAVAQALDVMSAEVTAGRPSDAGLRKIVLARSLLAVADRPIDAAGLLQRLHAADASVTAFLVPLPPQPAGAPRCLVGATPELLVSRHGRYVVSHPLAGSARRSADASEDAAARAALAASDKDRREHAMVAEFILDVLAPHCRSLGVPQGTTLQGTRSMWHLGTRIEGELRDPGLSVADLAALLHPTPAVCGAPQDTAAALIPQLEAMQRDFYAGTVGWCDRAGDGAWYVSIRCAEVAGHRARLYAGAGIVPGSEPAAELRETRAKFNAMLDAIGVAEAARNGVA